MITIAKLDVHRLSQQLRPLGLELVMTSTGNPIPGSFWGGSEAGLIGAQLHLRADTPVHSALHETSHYVCMSAKRRQRLHTDAGGCDLEESAVCCLQILLSQPLAGLDPQIIMRDMDEWGYSFRLGSTRAWFENDSSDAREALQHWRLVDHNLRPLMTLRC